MFVKATIPQQHIMLQQRQKHFRSLSFLAPAAIVAYQAVCLLCVYLLLLLRIISYIYPSRNEELLNKLKEKKATVIGEPSCSDTLSRGVGGLVLYILAFSFSPADVMQHLASLSADLPWAECRA